jgi:maltose-binding protein MalE
MLEAVKEEIYNKLNGTSAVTTLLASATAIYYEFAPTNAPMPYIVFNYAGGGSDNDTQLDSGNLMFYVKGVAKVSTTALSIATAIYNALHEQEASMTIDAPWTIYRVTHNEPISLTETEERTQYYHRGGSYRIRITQ